MKSSAKKVELASVDDLFSTEEGRQDAKLEKIQEIPLSELHPFKNHPFKVKDDEAMMETADSVRQYGVLVPAIARPDPEGGYELVAGHRRHRASELAEKETMPVIVRDLDDDAATIIMVDSNLQRESLLPSERAFAYKMKLEAVKHQGARTDLTSAQVGPKLTAAEKIAENSPDSKSQIKRYIRLTELIPELLDILPSAPSCWGLSVCPTMRLRPTRGPRLCRTSSSCKSGIARWILCRSGRRPGRPRTALPSTDISWTTRKWCWADRSRKAPLTAWTTP